VVAWLKTHFPGVPVLAVNDPMVSEFPARITT